MQSRMEAEFNQLREEKFKMADFGRDSMINVQKCISKWNQNIDENKHDESLFFYVGSILILYSLS